MQNPNDPQSQGQYPPPQYPPPQYPAQPPQYQAPVPAAPQSNTMAIVSLICGIGSFIILPFILAIVAVITGNKARSEIRASNGMQSGDGMAKVGVILGWVNIALVVLCGCGFLAITLLGAMSGGSSQ